MSPDLTTRIRAYAATIELEAPPVTPDEAQERAGTVATGLIRQPERRVRPGVVALAAAAIAVTLIGVPAVLLSRGGDSPASTREFGAAIDRSWERVDSAPDVSVQDVTTTGFGILAAAGPDGVWISENGVDWRQVLVGPYEPPAEPTTTPAPPLTAPPEEPLVRTEIGAVLEFDGRLYAFGRIWVSDSESVEEAGTFAWSSDDGLTWDRTAVGPFPQLIDAVAFGDAIFLFGRDVSEGEDGGALLLSTHIARSSDGIEWDPVTANGLEGTVLWAVAPSEDGFVALGERGRNDQAFVFTSPDGFEWFEAGPWTISPLNYSVWPQVDLFPSPHGLVAVSVTEDPQPTGEPTQIVIAVSTDGATFSVIDTSDPALQIDNVRNERWPPMTPPEATVFRDRIIMLGLSYPNTSGEPSHHQWITTVDAISPTATGSP